MKKQDTLNRQTTPSTQKKYFAWLSSIGAILVVALLIGVSVTAFAFWRTRHSTVAAPPSGQWQRVLNGYIVTSLMASQSNPSVLYACATHTFPFSSIPSHPEMQAPNYTLLHSTDNGSHWQEVKVALRGICQLTVNSTDSNDLYVVSLADHTASNGQVPTILKHSTDGGQTWTEQFPTFNIPGTQLPVQWNVQQLSAVGNRLFGVQWIPSVIAPPLGKVSNPMVDIALPASRLVESNDAGHTWTIIDNSFDPTMRSTRDYAVLPSDPQTIYELVGAPWGPLHPPVKPMPGVATGIFYGTLSLYKTTNGGATWTQLLTGLGYGSKIQIASGNPGVVYVGGSTGIMPLERPVLPESNVVGTVPSTIPQGENFLLHMSTDGGTIWHDVHAPSGVTFVQNWFVSTDGHVYLATGSWTNEPGGQPTVTRGTIVPSGTSVISPANRQTYSGQGSQVIINQGGVTEIKGYDPTSGKWSDVTKTPSSGTLLTVTPGMQKVGATLWSLSVVAGKQELYRYVR